MSKRDYYEILGLSKNASESDIKKAYRKVAMEHHPDRNPGNTASEEKFKEASEAYEVLGDKQKKAQYDRFGHQAFAGQQGGGGGGFSSGSFNFEDIFGDFGDIFGSIFGGHAKGASRRESLNIKVGAKISLKEAFLGTSKTFHFERREACQVCQGKGSSSGSSSTKTCPRCDGKGVFIHSSGFFTQREICSQCEGQGVIITDPCRNCRGSGMEVRKRELSIKIPAGIDSGTTLTVAREGNRGRSGTGDLYIHIHVEDMAGFEREAENLHVIAPVSFPTLLLGGEISFTHLNDKEVKVKIPAGSDLSKTFKVRGLGFPVINSPYRGNLLVHLRLEIPKKVTSEMKKKLEELKMLMG